jgi:hypothetical protein
MKLIKKHPDLLWSCFLREDRPVVVDITSVAESVSGEIEKLIPPPNYLLPWKHAWFEFTLPDGLRERIGVALRSVPLEKYHKTLDAGEYARTAHVIDAAFCVSIYGNAPQWVGWANDFLESNGKTIRTSFGFPNSDAVTDKKIRNLIHGKLLIMWMYVQTALVFLNCKNVVAENAAFPESKKRKTTIHDSDVVYKKLVVLLPGNRRAGGNAKGDAQDSVRLHICRGHFMDHRKNGLFGKDHLRGIYWVPMHAKGNKAVGEVVKRYELRVGGEVDGGKGDAEVV